MEEESAPKKQFRLKKKTLLWFLLVLFSIVFLLSVYFYFFYNKENPLGKTGSVQKEKEGSLGTVEVVSADKSGRNNEPIKMNMVRIKSTGEVYEKEITVEGKPVKLFILKSLYHNDIQEAERDLDVVVGILFDGNYKNILNSNWWMGSLISDEVDVESLGEDFFRESYFESIFKLGTSWEYLYYSNAPSFLGTDEYLKVVKEVFKEEDLERLEERLTLGETEGLILMPQLIHEVSD